MNVILNTKLKLHEITRRFTDKFDEKQKKKIHSLVKTLTRYDVRDWIRQVSNSECTKLLEGIHPEKLNVLEISAGQKWQELPFKSFRGVYYPEFDICKETLPERFDLIIADQVWEHIAWPYRATKNVYEMLAPGGYFLNTTPFLIRVHEMPLDCSRWTETGMKYLLAEGGFPMEKIVTGSWGNRACIRANLRAFPGWARRGYGSLKNEPDYPVIVWALAAESHGILKWTPERNQGRSRPGAYAEEIGRKSPPEIALGPALGSVFGAGLRPRRRRDRRSADPVWVGRVCTRRPAGDRETSGRAVGRGQRPAPNFVRHSGGVGDPRPTSTSRDPRTGEVPESLRIPKKNGLADREGVHYSVREPWVRSGGRDRAVMTHASSRALGDQLQVLFDAGTCGVDRRGIDRSVPDESG